MDKTVNSKLIERKIRPTAMRQLVLEVFMKQQTAISLADLEMKFDNVDKSTLFRTIKTFEEKNLIHSIDDGTGSVKYALCKGKCMIKHEDLHVHFLCTKCKNTFCLNDILIPSVNLPNGFSAENINMVVKGVCVNCK